MKTIVNNIFQNHGFLLRESSVGNLYSFPLNQEKISFWLVIEKDDLDILENQNQYFEACKNAIESNDIDKNTSLLILAKIPEDTQFKELKEHILTVEEDPYLFKKLVLFYSENELEELKFQISKSAEEPLAFIEQNIIVSENFTKYKTNPALFCWESLIYRITHKIPFVKINVEQDNNLQSLFDTNYSVLTNKGINEFADLMENSLFSLSPENFENLSPQEILERLTLETPTDEN
ncbi:hypothetical protein B0A67_03390 [Flavobacterium aquidurense]|uniref:ABC-three component system middle component 1 n=1 Tax=Flavobacterium aquidurense TaxID=362413 RepID=UPI000918F310|nr:ABC-three component system middle component 1 [Flavobacterium aquidurense]OXA73731.1 hypothetical protein B0A67_03390 [Flavobacterium aquidurense]SHG79023.1 hypothetical protein SAMN05444481_107172 [Flavobacterium frigidimaris]